MEGVTVRQNGKTTARNQTKFTFLRSAAIAERWLFSIFVSRNQSLP